MKRAPIPVIALEASTIQTIVSTVFSLVEAQLEAGFYLLSVDFEKEAGAWYLRIYIEGQEATISLNDCERISRVLDPLLETLAPLKDLPYSLEISSPGLFRPLRTAREFEFYRGRSVRVITDEAIVSPGRQEKVPPRLKEVAQGLLKAFDANRQSLSLQGSDGETAEEITLEPHMQVLLNPVICFPDESNEQESGEQKPSDDQILSLPSF